MVTKRLQCMEKNVNTITYALYIITMYKLTRKPNNRYISTNIYINIYTVYIDMYTYIMLCAHNNYYI